MLKRMLLPLLLISSLLAVSSTYAVAPGLYLGLMAGPATNSASTQYAQVYNSPTTTPASPKSTQFGTRIFMGYKANQYAGAEGGFTYFSTIRYDTNNVRTCSSANSRVKDLDFVFKGSVPLRSFEVFGKAGVAVAYQTSGGTFSPNFQSGCGDTTNVTKFVPTVSLGLGYDLSQNWVADASLNHVMVSGKIGTMDLYALGISYHFVDTFCGQFLCS